MHPQGRQGVQRTSCAISYSIPARVRCKYGVTAWWYVHSVLMLECEVKLHRLGYELPDTGLLAYVLSSLFLCLCPFLSQELLLCCSFAGNAKKGIV